MRVIEFDWRNPDYVDIFRQRVAALERLRAQPELLAPLKLYYRDNIAQFICDWGVTEDPRNVEIDLPTLMPFILFPRQIEYVEFVLRKWRERKPGLAEKSRDMGLSYTTVAIMCALCTFYNGFSVGFGSRKEEYVDEIGNPKSLFHKARVFLNNLPIEFRAGWSEKSSAHMRMWFPETGSTMTGEAGDNIGRGDRQSAYVVDESAHLVRPQLIEASLSATTNCRIDISSANGRQNPFAEKRFGGRIEIFTFHWRDDPRKDQAWRDKQDEELDPVTIAQEIEINYDASVEGVIIPHEWVRASIDAHIKLGITPSGERMAALDVADEGRDLNAFVGTHGILVEHLEEWSGKGSDIMFTTEKAINLATQWKYKRMKYDADGLGAGVRGDARLINQRRKDEQMPQVEVITFRGSGGVLHPEAEDVKGRSNLDYFANFKAQSWWALRNRFLNTFRWVEKGIKCDPDTIISLSSQLRLINKLTAELSQPTIGPNLVGKMVIDKAPDGAKSPNCGDGVMIAFSPLVKTPMRINKSVLAQA